MNGKSLNLEDIAKRAGVSRSTVSRVINNEPYVSDKTRQRVMAVIEQEGFSPNPAARMLVTQRSQVIGIVIPNSLDVLFDDPYYFPTLLRGITSITARRDYGSLLWLAQSQESPEKFHQRILSNRLMDGLILASATADNPLIDSLVEAKMPFVLVERPTRYQDRISYVTVNNVEAARIAVEHLLSVGRRRIATVAGNLAITDGQDRLEGYRIALEIAGISYNPNLVAEGRFNYQAGYLAMKQLLQQNGAIDAVFVASDRSAMGALKALNEAGVRVPDDIAMVGFDDQLDAVEAGLTTMRQPVFDKGARATEILIDLIEGKVDGPRQVLLPTQLVIRKSSGV
jgi:LacI family transcriptional regulator